jgi:methylmalonyl-CoA epimerase
LLKKIDHLGIAAENVEGVKNVFREIFGISPAFEEDVEEQKVHAVGFKLGASKLEFLEPTDEESPIAKYLAKKGAGLHHLAVQVDDIHAVIAKLKAAGLRMIDDEPREGAEGKLIAFVHPKSFFGILLELSQEI